MLVFNVIRQSVDSLDQNTDEEGQNVALIQVLINRMNRSVVSLDLRAAAECVKTAVRQPKITFKDLL